MQIARRMSQNAAAGVFVLTAFFFGMSWLMKKLPRDLPVKTSASSSVDSVASLSTSGPAQGLTEKSAWKQTSGVICLL